MRLKPADAAAALSVDVQTVYVWVREGTLTGFYPTGRGPGKRLWLSAAEVEAYALHGAEGVEEVRRAATAPPKKGRKK